MNAVECRHANNDKNVFFARNVKKVFFQKTVEL